MERKTNLLICLIFMIYKHSGGLDILLNKTDSFNISTTSSPITITNTSNNFDIGEDIKLPTIVNIVDNCPEICVELLHVCNHVNTLESDYNVTYFKNSSLIMDKTDDVTDRLYNNSDSYRETNKSEYFNVSIGSNFTCLQIEIDLRFKGVLDLQTSTNLSTQISANDTRFLFCNDASQNFESWNISDANQSYYELSCSRYCANYINEKYFQERNMSSFDDFQSKLYNACFCKANCNVYLKAELCKQSWYVLSDDNVFDCYPNCKKATSSQCDLCSNGWYGQYCEKECSDSCIDNSCEKDEGYCSCIDGWFGERCNQPCMSNCKKCIDNTTCIRCEDGFYGRHCDQSCPNGCTKCKRDGSKCYECTSRSRSYGDKCTCKELECDEYNRSLYCTKCKRPGWFVSLAGCCPCSEHCLGGATKCNMKTGKCLHGCKDGYYGDKCDEQCSSHCSTNGSICDSLTGECQNGCETDWFLPTCNFDCSLFYPYCTKCSYILESPADTSVCLQCIDGYYMPQKYQLTGHKDAYLSDYCFPCDHCINQNCDGTSGVCKDGCTQHGRYNSKEPINGETLCLMTCNTCNDLNCNSTNGNCINGCVNGYFGERCDSNCSSRCFNNTCQQPSGKCLSCIDGYYGDTCNTSCGQCSDGKCQQSSGDCGGDCLQDFYGLKCDTACDSCVGNMCDENGKCVYGCKPGWHGLLCNLKCPDDCVVCHKLSGLCLLETKLGNETDMNVDYISTEAACLPGKYGFYCENYCKIGCKSVKGSLVPICDRFLGYCHECLNGFHGYDCGIKCNKTCDGKLCYRNGTCYNGCIDRWQGVYCQNHFPPTIFERFGGIFFGLMCFTVFSIGLAFIVFRNRKDKKRIVRQKSASQIMLNFGEQKTYV